MPTTIPTYRITLTADEINDVVYDLQLMATMHNLSTTTRSALKKLQRKAYDDKIGAATPAYVQTGRTKSLSNTDLMHALSEPAKQQPKVIVDRRGNPDAVDLSNYTQEQLSEAEFDSANHLAMTGDKLPLIHFLPKLIPTIERRKDQDNKNDDDDTKFAGLFGK